MAHLLIVDDEQSIQASLKEILEYEGHKVALAGTGMDGVLAATKTAFDAIFCDVKMPQMDGLDVLDMLAKKGVSTPVVMISGHGTVDTAVQALKKGAYDFIQKPLDLNRVLVTLRNVLERGDLVAETKVLKKQVHQAQSHAIVGESKGIREVLHMVETVGPTDARVLITGGNGSGKELVARQLHNQSERAEGPFVEVNCAAIPSELIESELFGHEKGAFTSAVAMRKGKFEQADGGTLFLDEVGDMSASAQAKVLRALQENKVIKGGQRQGHSCQRAGLCGHQQKPEGSHRQGRVSRRLVPPVGRGSNPRAIPRGAPRRRALAGGAFLVHDGSSGRQGGAEGCPQSHGLADRGCVDWEHP